MHLDGAADDDITPHDAASSRRLIEGRGKAASAASRAPAAGQALAWLPGCSSRGVQALIAMLAARGLPSVSSCSSSWAARRIIAAQSYAFRHSRRSATNNNAQGPAPECWSGTTAQLEPLQLAPIAFGTPTAECYGPHKHRRIAIGCFGTPATAAAATGRRSPATALPACCPRSLPCAL